MISMRIAIIGIDQRQNLQLAQQVHQFIGYPIVKDTNDEMKYLLNLDVKKYFSAYQMHILLNRCREWSKPGDKIFCDALFTSYHSMVAALESGVINESEFLVYKDKQSEYIDTLKECDLILNVTKQLPTLNEVDAPAIELPFSYYQLCYDLYMKKVQELRSQMKERFVDLDVGHNTTETLMNLLHREAVEEQIEEKHVLAEVNQDEQADEQNQTEVLKKKLYHEYPNMIFLEDSNEIKTLIETFQDGFDISSCVPCIAFNDDHFTCLKLIHADGDESIRCKMLSSIEEVIEFFA